MRGDCSTYNQADKTLETEAKDKGRRLAEEVANLLPDEGVRRALDDRGAVHLQVVLVGRLGRRRKRGGGRGQQRLTLVRDVGGNHFSLSLAVTKLFAERV